MNAIGQAKLCKSGIMPDAVAAILDPIRFREAWARAGRVEPVIPSETDAAARLASAENIDFCEALARVKGMASLALAVAVYG